MSVQLGFGPVPALRFWFISEDQRQIVQVQNDRLIVNWRQVQPTDEYPRFPHMRGLFEDCWGDFSAFVQSEQLGDLELTQVEVNYINAVDVQQDQLGQLQRVLRGWDDGPEHHLGLPEQARVALTFAIPDLGAPPSRMYVSVDPAKRPTGSDALFMTLTARGAPAVATIAGVLNFMDDAHAHLVQTFLELTPKSMHAEWGLEDVSAS